MKNKKWTFNDFYNSGDNSSWEKYRDYLIEWVDPLEEIDYSLDPRMARFNSERDVSIENTGDPTIPIPYKRQLEKEPEKRLFVLSCLVIEHLAWLKQKGYFILLNPNDPFEQIDNLVDSQVKWDTLTQQERCTIIYKYAPEFKFLRYNKKKLEGLVGDLPTSFIELSVRYYINYSK